MKVCKRFKFDAAHYLKGYEGACGRLHGHTWFLEVIISGPVVDGFVIDFVDLKQIVNETIIDKVDHQLLNDLVDYPTCENLLPWMLNSLTEGLYKVLSSVYRVTLRLYESPDSYAEYDGND